MYTKNRISRSARQFCWILCHTNTDLVKLKEWNVKLICLMWSTHTYIFNTPVKTIKCFVLMKQIIHHSNVDCVYGHLEIEMIQCVKRWPFINIQFLRPFILIFGNVLRLAGKEAVRRKSLLQYCDAESGGDLTSESWGFVPSKPFQIASVDHLEFSYLSPCMSTWKRPPAVKYPQA